jgi:hypothetical protein
MRGIAVLPLERRLRERYAMLVDSHLHAVNKLAAGVVSLPSTASAFAATQAAWRFHNNERVTFEALVQPVRDAGRQQLASEQSKFALLVHDWCKLSFDRADQRDLAQLTHETDVGYELTTALLVSAADGRPLAPLEMHLKTAAGTLSTRGEGCPTQPHLEQVLPTMQASRNWNLPRPLLHVIDREADSVDHYRQWDADGHKFLVRGDNRSVRWNGVRCDLQGIRQKLRRKQQFQSVGPAEYRGREAQLWVAETEVVLDRPAKKNVRGKKFHKPGRELTLRLIVVEIRDENGKVLAHWLLLTNVASYWATAAELARCYYWRWRIESFFKLLKSHGQHLESWQQETGPAIFRRLLVAAMACVVVWQLQADSSPAATELKNVLIRLSGRQTKRKHPHTAPALLAGLGMLLSMLALLEQYDLRDLQKLIHYLPSLKSA